MSYYVIKFECVLGDTYTDSVTIATGVFLPVARLILTAPREGYIPLLTYDKHLRQGFAEECQKNLDSIIEGSNSPLAKLGSCDYQSRFAPIQPVARMRYRRPL